MMAVAAIVLAVLAVAIAFADWNLMREHRRRRRRG
jgi:hypothetical protein